MNISIQVRSAHHKCHYVIPLLKYSMWFFGYGNQWYRYVKAQLRDLCYYCGNLYPNCIIRHMLIRWTDHALGICGWGVRMALKGLDIRMCMFSELASCIFTVPYISIIFSCSVFMCYDWISLGICSCILARV